MKRHFLGWLLGTAAVLVSGLAAAQPYPAKPVRLVVPFPAGGATDILARTISLKAAEKLGQQIVIDNRPGAGGTIGSDHVAKSAPDGRFTAMMPHPERVFRNIQMSWTNANQSEFSPWLQLWRNARRWLA